MTILAVLGLLVVAALAGAAAGGLFDRRPVVVPPGESPSPSPVPTASPQASPPAPSPSTVLSVQLIGFDGRALSTIEVVDASGTLVGARTGRPAEDPSDPSPTVRNDPADPTTVLVSWYGLLSDTDRRLTLAPDGRTMTLDVIQGCGDLLPVTRALALTFNAPVPADAVAVTIVVEPRTCE